HQGHCSYMQRAHAMNTRVFNLAVMFASAVLLLSPPPATGQTARVAASTDPTAASQKWTPPRTPWGEPDLQGTFSNRTITPFERPANVGGREFFTKEEVAAPRECGQERHGEA